MFRRYVRRHIVETSPDLPLGLIQDLVRDHLSSKRHSIIESTWVDQTADIFSLTPRKRRIVSVRYVTGGQRHGLPASLDWDRFPAAVEFPGRRA